jgi:hypothetical protein
MVHEKGFDWYVDAIPNHIQNSQIRITPSGSLLKLGRMVGWRVGSVAATQVRGIRNRNIATSP